MHFLKRIASYAQYPGVYQSEVRQLRKAQKESNFSALWRYLEGSSLSDIIQKRAELKCFLTVLEKQSLAVVLEIGTGQGGTLLYWAWVSARDAEIITVDLHHGPFGGGHRRSQAWVFKKFARQPQRIRFVRGDSHNPQTHDRVKKLLRGRGVDLLFIDGDHSHEGVQSDYRLYGPLVRPSGIIAFHDIVPAPYESGVGVPMFWQELKKHAPVHEIVEDWNQGGFGIGWFTKS